MTLKKTLTIAKISYTRQVFLEIAVFRSNFAELLP
jgi:hypothetical protein